MALNTLKLSNGSKNLPKLYVVYCLYNIIFSQITRIWKPFGHTFIDFGKCGF
jgi:hypothetical protein